MQKRNIPGNPKIPGLFPGRRSLISNEEIGRYFSETRKNCVLIFFRRYQTDPVRGLTDAKAKANLGRVHLPAFYCFNVIHVFLFSDTNSVK
jgi:hypothetical protein